ncbi:MAG TPA: thioredoxin family protein [Spirochaetia bacterium]|nr:thioredoxin family protein [Spirochaetia bacterium]
MIYQLAEKAKSALCVICLFLLPGPASAQVEAGIAAENTSIQPGRAFTAAIHFRMAPGWHIYGQDPGDTGLPTTVSWDLPKGFAVGDLAWPPPQRFVSQGSTSYGYEGEVSLLARMTPPSDLASPGKATIRAHVGWLACRIECTPGRADLALALPVTSAAPAVDARWAAVAAAAGAADAGAPTAGASTPSPGVGLPGFLIALALAFIGGVILNLMPCVLPVISLKVFSFIRNSGDGQGSALRHGLLFAAGVLVSFWVIAGVLTALRAGGQLIGWGFQFQSPVIVTITAALFFLIGLNLLGVFEFNFPIGVGSLSGRTGSAGSFLSGLLATAVATPCTAPFMGAALGYALTQPAAVSFVVFTALALGLAAPYVLLSALPGLAKRIPRPGPWMVTLRQVLAFPMLGAVIWMMYVLETQTGFPSILVLLSTLLAAGLGAWIYGRWGGVERTRRSRVISACLAVVLVVGATAFSASRSAAAVSSSAPGTASDPARGAWEPWSPGRLSQLQAAGTPVFVDFTAKWCLTCQVNEKVALENPAVQSAFHEAEVATLRADWTDRNDAIAAALARLGRAGVPVYALYPRGSSIPVLLPEVLTPGVVLEALRKLR